MNTEIFNLHGLKKRTRDRIMSMLESTFGRKFDLESLEYITDGLAKMSFKIVIKDHGDFLLQVWQEPEIGLTSIKGSDADLLWPGGLNQVIKNKIFLESIGVRVPHIIASDVHNDPCIAIFEYIDGIPLVEMDKDEIPDLIYSRIGDLVGRIHSHTSIKPGIADENNKTTFDCLELVHSVTMKELFLACEYDSFTKEARTKILETLGILRSQASHRQTYNLIHGDSLQMIISRYHEPVLIDIDAMQYFDLEYEYCIMDLPHINLLSRPAFIESYQKLISPNCEYYRLQYYRICKLVSWLSYFAEALRKTYNTILEARYKNTRQLLRNALEQV